MDTFTVVSIVTFVGFVALAAALLGPLYMFLKREETASEVLTQERLARDDAADEEVEQPVTPDTDVQPTAH